MDNILHIINEAVDIIINELQVGTISREKIEECVSKIIIESNSLDINEIVQDFFDDYEHLLK